MMKTTFGTMAALVAFSSMKANALAISSSEDNSVGEYLKPEALENA